MDTGDVWRLVEEARSESDQGAADVEQVTQHMVAALARRAPAEIVGFAQPL